MAIVHGHEVQCQDAESGGSGWAEDQAADADGGAAHSRYYQIVDTRQ